MIPRAMAILGFACAVAAAADPLPAHELFKPQLHRAYALSPDGRYLLEFAMTDKDDADRLQRIRSKEDLLKLARPDQKVLLTDLRSMEYLDLTPSNTDVWVDDFRWLGEREFAWSRVDRRSREVILEIRTIGQDAAGKMRIEATRALGRDAYILTTLADAPGQMLVVHYDDEGESLYRIDARRPLYLQTTAANRLGGPFRGVEDWVVDRSGALRAVSLMRRASELRIMVPAAPGLKRSASFDLADLESTKLVGYDDARRRLLLLTNRGSDKVVLRALDPDTGALGDIIVGDARNDLSGVFHDPRDGRVIGAIVDDNATRIEFIDEGVRRLQAQAVKAMPRLNPRVINFSADRKHAIVYTGQSDDPGRYYLLELATGKPLLIESVAPWLDGLTLSRTEPIEFKARDGLVIRGQFTRPAAPRPPVVLMPHGGPFGYRDTLTFDPNVQFLVSRGYAVLQVDFRGSGGYGREFQVAGYKRWGGEMQTDLVDALDHVIGKGWVDPKRACAYGISYGGYAAMMSVLQQPERFRCAVTYAGVSDLTLLFKSAEWRRLPFLQGAITDLMRKRVGDPESERAALQARSPAYLAKDLKRPVLIAHGDADRRAEPEHAWRLRAAIEAGGGKVEWFMAKGEGHGFRKAENIEAFYATLEKFLATNLAEP